MDINSEEFALYVKKNRQIRMKELDAIIKSSGRSNLLEKFGVVALYVQMIEETLKILIIQSNELNGITTEINFDELTFGRLIGIFDQFVIKLDVYNELKSKLDECKEFRNALIHKIFQIEYFFDIVEMMELIIDKLEIVLEILDRYRINFETQN